MALDESKEEDHTMEQEGLTFVMSASDQEMIFQVGGMQIDFVSSWHGNGFQVTSGTSVGC